MKNSIFNFVMAGIWTVAAIISIINKAYWPVIGYNVVLIVYFLVLGISQKVYLAQGEEGIPKLRKVQILALIMMFVMIAIITVIGM